MLSLWHWVYKYFFRPIIYLLTCWDPEVATDWATKLLEWIEQSPKRLERLERFAKVKDSRLEFWALGQLFRGLVGLAAGWTKNGRALRALCSIFDFVIIGTVTPEEQKGFPRPRIWRLLCFFRWVLRLVFLNRMGFPNEGALPVANRLRSYHERFGPMSVPVGVSIGAMATTGPEKAANDYITVYRVMRETADEVIAFFEINISSPNTDWLRLLGTANYFERFLGQILEGFREVDKELGRVGKPIVLKLSPDMLNHEVRQLLDVCRQLGVYAISGVNTTQSRRGLWGKVVKMLGGISGWFVYPLALEKFAVIRQHDQNVSLIAGGGINSFHTAWLLDAIGQVKLFTIFTAFFNEFPFLPREINKGYLREMELWGVGSIEELREKKR